MRVKPLISSSTSYSGSKVLANLTVLFDDKAEYLKMQLLVLGKISDVLTSIN